MKSKKLDILVPVWNGKPNENYWGSTDYADYMGSSSSSWISLRLARGDDDWVTDTGRAYQDIGVYVWFSEDDSINLDIRAHDIGSTSLHELERLIKTIKSLRAKVAKTYQLDQFIRGSDIHTELTKFFQALGVTKSLVYTPGSYSRTTDGEQPIGITIKRISDVLDQRLAAMKQRKAA